MLLRKYTSCHRDESYVLPCSSSASSLNAVHATFGTDRGPGGPNNQITTQTRVRGMARLGIAHSIGTPERSKKWDEGGTN